MRSGSSFAGSNKVEKSVANKEILPKGSKLYKFSIMIEQDCTVSINKSESIFIKGGVGFSTNQVDAIIRSFKIVESGKDFYWIGGY